MSDRVCQPGGAPRRPTGAGGPSVVSTAVWCSISALIFRTRHYGKSHELAELQVTQRHFGGCRSGTWRCASEKANTANDHKSRQRNINTALIIDSYTAGVRTSHSTSCPDAFSHVARDVRSRIIASFELI